MKKTIFRSVSLLLALVLLLASLTACSYRPRKSTDEEATPVITFGENTVNFEVLYAFFHGRAERAQGYSADYFEGAEGEVRFAEILEGAVSDVAEIYAMLDACRAVGIDPYSEEIEDAVTEQVKLTVKGGAVDGVIFPGYDSYEDYLADIRESYHMNDAVARLMIRYGICEELLIDYYENEHPYTDDDVSAFFMSDNCIHIVHISRSESDGGFGNGFAADDVREFNLDLVTTARNHLLDGNDDKACQLTTRRDPKPYIGRYTYDRAYYATLIDTAFALPEGGVSEVMDLGTEGFHVVKRLAKDLSDLESNAEFAALTEAYLYDLLTGDVLTRAATLLSGVTYTEAYTTLTKDNFLK